MCSVESLPEELRFSRCTRAFSFYATLTRPPSSVDRGLESAADPLRLIDVSDWSLAPSAGVLGNLGGSGESPATTDGCDAPLRLVVADTFSSQEFPALDAARAQAKQLQHLPGVDLLGGVHWSERPATRGRLVRSLGLQTMPYTAAFLCHAIRGSSERPSESGILLAPVSPEREPAGSPETLSAADIVSLAQNGIRMPDQVLLQACDTSALSDTGAGEWLTIAPAFIASGSVDVVSTLFPLLDEFVTDDPIIHATVSGGNIVDALRRHQRVSALRWTTGHASSDAERPLYWAAFAPICSRAVSVPEVEDPSASQRLEVVMSEAFEAATWTFGGRLDSSVFLHAYLEESMFGELLSTEEIFSPTSLLWGLGPYFLAKYFRTRDKGADVKLVQRDQEIDFSVEMESAFTSARQTAMVDGSVVEPEHVLLALLGRDTAARAILRRLGFFTAIDCEMLVRAVEQILYSAAIYGNSDPWIRGWSTRDRREQPRWEALRIQPSRADGE